MLLQSQRFGQIEISENEIIKMVRPVLGYESLSNYYIVESEEFEPFRWLQSVENPDVAFAILNPCLFAPDYKIEINPNEISEIEPEDLDKVDIYVIATIANNSRNFTVNLQAPLLINRDNKKGKQLVLMNSEFNVRHAGFDAETSESPIEVIETEEPAGVL